jgi:hypothetical protein
MNITDSSSSTVTADDSGSTDAWVTFAMVLSYITDALTGLSLAGCVITIVTFILFKELRTYPIKLIIYLSFCLLFAQSFFLSAFYVYDQFFCIPAAMIFHYFFLANFFWSFCVAFNFYQMIVRYVKLFSAPFHLPKNQFQFILNLFYYILLFAPSQNFCFY